MPKNFLLRSFSLFVLSSFAVGLSAQNVGIGTSVPAMKLHVEANAASDGVIIDNIAANGDPIMQFRVNGTSRFTMGVDDSDADKFKLGNAAITTNTRITITTGGNIGFRTTAPGNMFHMTDGGVAVGATSMANFENTSASGVAIAGRNTSAGSGYNAIEGITDYNGSAFIPAGVFGLAIYNGTNNSTCIGVRAASNEWQGTGMRASRFNGGGANTGWGGEVYDDLGYTGFLGTISDKRTKKNIQPFVGAIAIVNQLNPVTYEYDLERYPTMGLSRTEEFGFIAQEVKSVLPTLTREKTLSTNACEEIQPGTLQENKSEKFLVMDYVRLVPILTQAIKEQQTQIMDLEQKANRVDQLENELDDLRTQLDALRQQMSGSSGGN